MRFQERIFWTVIAFLFAFQSAFQEARAQDIPLCPPLPRKGGGFEGDALFGKRGRVVNFVTATVWDGSSFPSRHLAVDYPFGLRDVVACTVVPDSTHPHRCPLCSPHWSPRKWALSIDHIDLGRISFVDFGDSSVWLSNNAGVAPRTQRRVADNAWLALIQ